MATKKKTDATTTKTPRKRTARAAEETPTAGDAAVARIHQAGAVLDEPTGPVEQRLVREPPFETEADAAAAEEAGSALSAIVQRALRFSEADHAFVHLTNAACIGVSPRGTVIIPWSVPALPAEGVVVDGRKLHRCLRAAGDAAQLDIESGRVRIRFGTRRFTVSIVPGTDLSILHPPREGVNYSAFKPSVFRTAVAFAGNDKIEPRDLAGVNVSLGGCIASDRRGLILAFNATDNSALNVTLPRDTFDGLSVGDNGDESVWFGMTEGGHAIICDPRTGEWRVVVVLGYTFPDVRGVLARWDAVTHVDVDKVAFVSALKQFRIVQSAGSSVKFNVWTAPPGTEGAGDWIEMRGGDPSNTCEFVARLGVKIHRTAPVGVPVAGGGAHMDAKCCVALDELLKLATAFPSTVVRIGFGATERDPIVVKTHVFEAGVMPMVDR